MHIKVTNENKEQVIVGAENNKHLEISILLTPDLEYPKVEGRAYVFTDGEFSEYQSWDIGALEPGKYLKIEASEEQGVTEPTSIELSTNYRKKRTEGSKAFLKDMVQKTKENIEEIRAYRGAPEIEVCSFCGKHKSEVSHLVPKLGVAICNECISMCNDIISNR